NAGEDVGNGRHGRARRATSAPGVRLPGYDSPVFLCRHFDLGVAGGSGPRYFQIDITLQQQLDGLACQLRQPGVLNPPTVCAEFAAEPAPDVLADSLNV